MKTGYSCSTEAAVALVAATPKTVIGARGGAAFGLDLIGFRVAFDGVTASAVPVLIELCYATFATNAPGTNSTAITVDTVYGRAIAHGMGAARAWTVEPTVLTPIDEWLLTPNGGLVIVNIPRDRTPDTAVGEGFALRMNAPANVNVRASMTFERG